MAELRAENVDLREQLAGLKKDKKVKSKQISDLQDHFNLLTSSYFELKKKLEADFGEKYQTSVEEQRINLHVHAFPFDLPVG